MKKHRKKQSVGRPLGKILSKDAGCRRLFQYADSQGFSLMKLREILSEELGAGSTPSYRTLQEWRRGTHKPFFVPFGIWLTVLKKYTASENLARED